MTTWQAQVRVDAFDHILAKLSKRENQILMQLLRAKTTKDMAALYKISCRTVESHTVNIKNKLGCKNRADLFELAFKHGLLTFCSMA